MTIHSLVDRFRQLLSWLWYRHEWTAWELTAAAAAILLLLLLSAAKKRRDQRKARAMTPLLRQSSSVIGPRLASRNLTPTATTDLKRPCLPFLTGRNNQITASESATASDHATAEPQHETIKDQQTEAHLRQQLSELKATNKKLQIENVHCKETEKRLRQRTARLLATGKKLRQELVTLEQTEQTLRSELDTLSQRFAGRLPEGTRATKRPKWSPLDLLATRRLSRSGPNPREYESQLFPASPRQGFDSRRTKEPLDVEKLKAIAALARQIQSRPRRS